MRSTEENIDDAMDELYGERAGLLYETYCKAVGGKAFNGDLLPAWKTFRADPSKKKQSDAWIEVAITSVEVIRAHEYTEQCRPTGNPEKGRSGIGMPQTLWLQEFGDLLYHAFGEFPYHVGSSLKGGVWRDVDVRIMLDGDKYAAMGFGDPKNQHENERWCAYVKAFSELGRRMTGLPIDFQIQHTATANDQYSGHENNPRSALILCGIRRSKQYGEWLKKEKNVAA